MSVTCTRAPLPNAPTHSPDSGVADSPASALRATPFHVIAHRGGAGLAPENTLPAFQRSLDSGFDEVELDVRLSLDDVVVLYHDPTLERKTGHSGSVAVYTADELTQFEIGSWFDREHPDVAFEYAGTPIITLDALFAAFGARLHYHIEIKGEDPRVAEHLLASVDAAGLRSRVTVASFSAAQIRRFRALAAEIPICHLLARVRELPAQSDREPVWVTRQRAAIDAAAAAGFEQVAVHVSEIGTGVVDYAHDRGLAIRAWGLKSGEDERRVIESGSDGATTDWPERLRARLSR